MNKLRVHRKTLTAFHPHIGIYYTYVMEMRKILITGGSGFIGVHLVEYLLGRNFEIKNIDIRPPINGRNMDLWESVSILDKNQLQKTLIDFNPSFIVHLAATTTQNSTSLDDFEVNTEGTQNLFQIAVNLKDLKKIIFTSTQYVNTPGFPLSAKVNELRPYGFYGLSKLMGEQMAEQLLGNSNWIIIRPTTIWGPWHPILTDGLWKQIKRGLYFHPKKDEAIKAYGYVRNTAWQIGQLLEIESSLTNRKVFYIGDGNNLQSKWVSTFVEQLTSRKMREIPRSILFVASEFGEILIKLGLNFPLYRSRYHNLVTSNPAPLAATLDLLGPSPISLEKAVEETIFWLNQTFCKSKLVD